MGGERLGGDVLPLRSGILHGRDETGVHPHPFLADHFLTVRRQGIKKNEKGKKMETENIGTENMKAESMGAAAPVSASPVPEKSAPPSRSSSSKTYKAVRSASLSSTWDPRFVIVDEATGEVLDDAQGYGYKSAQNAYAAWSYKTRSPEKKAKAERIDNWLRENKTFDSRMTQCSFYAFEDGTDLTAKDVKVLLAEGADEGDLVGEVPGTAAEILRAWNSGNFRKNRRKKNKKRK